MSMALDNMLLCIQGGGGGGGYFCCFFCFVFFLLFLIQPRPVLWVVKRIIITLELNRFKTGHCTATRR